MKFRDIEWIENTLQEIRPIANVFDIEGGDRFFDAVTANMEPEMKEAFKKTCLEFKEIENRDASGDLPYINRVGSGKIEYNVFRGLCPEDGEEEDGFLAHFEDEDEAYAFANSKDLADSAEVVEYDPEEWFFVVDKSGKNVFGMAFPYKLRAIAHIYIAEAPQAYIEYQYLRLKKLSKTEELKPADSRAFLWVKSYIRWRSLSEEEKQEEIRKREEEKKSGKEKENKTAMERLLKAIFGVESEDEEECEDSKEE